MKAVITSQNLLSECCRQRRKRKALAVVCMAESGLPGQGGGQEM